MNEFSEEDIQKEIETVKVNRSRGADALEKMKQVLESTGYRAPDILNSRNLDEEEYRDIAIRNLKDRAIQDWNKLVEERKREKRAKKGL